MREAELIKNIAPPFNVREKDDKSFLYIEITKEKFPRVVLVRGKDWNPPPFPPEADPPLEDKGEIEGVLIFLKLEENLPKPLIGKEGVCSSVSIQFVSASCAREAMKIFRRIFPWNTHPA